MKYLLSSLALLSIPTILIVVLPGRQYSFENTNSEMSSSRQSVEQTVNSPLCGLDDVVCDGEAVEVGKESAEFSAYSPSPDETDSSPFITADGTDLRKTSGCIIANNSLEFGRKVYIHSLNKVCEVHDRMNKRYGKDNFDIVFATKSEALQFGRKTLEYTVMD